MDTQKLDEWQRVCDDAAKEGTSLAKYYSLAAIACGVLPEAIAEIRRLLTANQIAELERREHANDLDVIGRLMRELTDAQRLAQENADDVRRWGARATSSENLHNICAEELKAAKYTIEKLSKSLLAAEVQRNEAQAEVARKTREHESTARELAEQTNIAAKANRELLAMTVERNEAQAAAAGMRRALLGFVDIGDGSDYAPERDRAISALSSTAGRDFLARLERAETVVTDARQLYEHGCGTPEWQGAWILLRNALTAAAAGKDGGK